MKKRGTNVKQAWLDRYLVTKTVKGIYPGKVDLKKLFEKEKEPSCVNVDDE